jgi:hypothetical protein
MVLGLIFLMRVLLDVLRIAKAIKPRPPVIATVIESAFLNG